MDSDLDFRSEEDLGARYFLAKKPGRIYVSRRFEGGAPDGSKPNMRYISEVIDGVEHWSEATHKGERILRITDGRREEILATVYEDTRGISVLTIQRYKRDGRKPIRENFSFIGDEISTLKEFIESIPYLDIPSDGKQRVEHKSIKADIEKVRDVLAANPDLDVLIEMAQTKITKADVVALAFRKEQLNAFQELLCANANEATWQAFFEKNVWIFGYGLNYVFNSPLEGRKLEQIVRGSDITSAGKRVDGLLKTRGIISSICLVEIKTPNSKLLKAVGSSYRPDCWQVSDELNGGIAQIQKTVEKTVSNIAGKLFQPKHDSGELTGERIYTYEPRSYLVIGSHAEFMSATGENPEKYSSFELYRKNMINPEIITFDELYERARFIVQSNEDKQIQTQNDEVTAASTPLDDLPF